MAPRLNGGRPGVIGIVLDRTGRGVRLETDHREHEDLHMITQDLRIWLELEIPLVEDGNSFGESPSLLTVSSLPIVPFPLLRSPSLWQRMEMPDDLHRIWPDHQAPTSRLT